MAVSNSNPVQTMYECIAKHYESKFYKNQESVAAPKGEMVNDLLNLAGGDFVNVPSCEKLYTTNILRHVLKEST